jgi:DNA-binding transcriptional LysR family regulator
VPVSQISRALARIEKACGARLIHRSTHGLALTAEGETFLSTCRSVGAAVDALHGEFAERSGEPGGLVRVAASSVIAQYLLVPSLPMLAQRHPQLRIDLEVSDRMADLARDAIDIAIRTTDALPETMVARRIGSLGRALYAAPAYAKLAGLPRCPSELHGHRLVANSAVAHLNQWPFTVDGRALKFAADGHWRGNDTSIVVAMVLHGLGIGRLATVVAAPLVREGRLLPVLADWVDAQPVPIHAITASSRQRLPKIRACIDHWAAVLGGDGAGVS